MEEEQSTSTIPTAQPAVTTNAKQTQLRWDEIMEVDLLEEVIVQGIHKETNDRERGKLWITALDNLFLLPNWQRYKADFYDPKVKDYKKLREKLTDLKKKAKKDMEDGNKSKWAGSLTKTFKLIEQILEEEAAAEADKTTAKEADDFNKKHLQETSDRITGKAKESTREPLKPVNSDRDYGKTTVSIDGVASDGNAVKRLKSSTLDVYLQQKMAKANAS